MGDVREPLESNIWIESFSNVERLLIEHLPSSFSIVVNLIFSSHKFHTHVEDEKVNLT